MTKLASFAILIVALNVSSALAHTRNCSTAEKAAANARLLEIASDSVLSNRLINWHLRFGTPVPSAAGEGERVLVQDGYVMGHDDDLRTALWVGYRLTDKDRIDASRKERVNCFRQDPRLTREQGATTTDYKEPIFDQGHMTNDADLKDDLTEQLNTYVMSNMSPQHCRFNRGIWLSLEDITRRWAEKYDTIYVVSGAIFDRNNDDARDPDDEAQRMESNNGNTRVGVPSHYYKVIVRRDDDGYKSISFLIPHTNDARGKSWQLVKPHAIAAITSLASIEDKADLSLHPELDRGDLAQSSVGEDWDLESAASNLEPSDNNTCVQ